VVALRILISQQAIELDPIVVEAMTQRELDARSRGTMIHEVTREEVERAARTSRHLGDILRQTVPGLQVRDTRITPGARICVEFRGRRSVRFGVGCQTPVLLLDGVRMHDPPSLYSTLDPGSIERIEVVPPAEAGLLYGSDSAFGIIRIETRLWHAEEGTAPRPRRLRGGVYDWTLEVESYSWKKVFLTTALGNALGVVAGASLARNCIQLESLARDVSTTNCDTWPTLGSWVAAFTFPLLGSSLAARYSGSTPVSRGRLVPALSAGALTLIPAYAMASSAQLDGVSPTRAAGFLLLGVGVPAAVTAADYLFRKLRSR
jgi:hypothetical protein